ncbi:hypothetical protein [Streptomyces albus]|nr:hypothetical protein [Streptomyces albus]
MLTLHQAARAGWFAEADPLLAELLGPCAPYAEDRLAAEIGI